MRPVCSLSKFIFAALVVFTLSAGLIGASYSLFMDANIIKSNVLMGDIDVSFIDIYIEQDESSGSSCATSAGITDIGRLIEINVQNAYPGYTSTVFYEITNNGSVPVTCGLIPSDSDSAWERAC